MIREQVGQIPSDVQNNIMDLLAGDSDAEFTWFSGDDEFENTFVGSVSQTSAQTDADYSRLRQAHGLIARTEQSMAAYLQQINLNATNLGALGEIVTTLVASTNGNTAAFEEQIRVLTSFTEATAESVSTLSVSMGNSLGQITEELSVHTDDIETLTTSLTTLVSSTNNSFAAMQEDITLLTTETEANSTAISTLSSTVGQNSADIQILYQTSGGDNSIASHYQIRLSAERDDGLRAVTGIALGAAIGMDGIPQSQIILLANDLVIAGSADGEELTQPFTFNTVTGTAYLRNALIENASIGSAKFTDWLYSDSLDVNDNPILGLNFRTGVIKSGVSGYKNGKGYYVGPVDPGNPSSAIGFFVGDSAGTHMFFDSSGLNIEGPLVATGNILNNAVTDFRYFVASSSVGTNYGPYTNTEIKFNNSMLASLEIDVALNRINIGFNNVNTTVFEVIVNDVVYTTRPHPVKTDQFNTIYGNGVVHYSIPIQQQGNINTLAFRLYRDANNRRNYSAITVTGTIISIKR